MPYRFETENKDYSAYASGRVFYNSPGRPAFPVRLISEVFQRCHAVRQGNGQTAPAVIYDPCCGSGYHLSVLGYLHRSGIKQIIGSDINAGVLETAQRNLSLLSLSGLDRRQCEIENLIAEFGKASHSAALEIIHQFKTHLTANEDPHPIKTELFQADGLRQAAIASKLSGRPVDIVLADVPYGDLSQWHVNKMEEPPLMRLLESLSAVVTSQTVVAIMADKAQKCNHPRYNRVDRFQIGKRRIFLLQLNGS